ncbi:hypothetical protein Vretimale_15552 [Volvox reticuliferus]|uniref:Methyltransferase domain-containing protein n=1 Tax=Volvox reticuliferus TaxID=1737510 RepID=A0A8J4CWQ9_9CHLO|nr:hypothetical protein Vretifemale_15083 [Volvox reticuliferus]GIM12133.1 hypothetical protein Vretimale_15552 [Volvox reticuliferus]
MARSHLPLSHEALMLDVLQNLPSPGGKNVTFHELDFLLGTEQSLSKVAWADVPPSCDPVFILDNLANNTRRKGNMEQQLSQMVLGRPGESSRVATTAYPGATSRGTVKRWQVESFAAVLRHLLNDADRHLHVVDFGCGTGTLLLPLAVLFPHCTFTGVEMKPAAVALLLERARAAGLSNVAARRCMIEEFLEEPFDVALALHACGNATDAAMQLAVRRHAAYIVSPCCVGKLKFSLAGGSSFSPVIHSYTPMLPGERRGVAPSGAAAPGEASGQFECVAERVEEERQRNSVAVVTSPATTERGPAECEDVNARERGAAGSAITVKKNSDGVVTLGEIRHPRSRWLRNHLPDPEVQFRIMAKVADQNHTGGSQAALMGRQPGNLEAVAARLCKAHVELDRSLAAAEEFYAVGMFKCFQWEKMAKSDLLVGVPANRSEWLSFTKELQRYSSLDGL